MIAVSILMTAREIAVFFQKRELLSTCGRVQPLERVIRFWAVPVRGVGGRDAAVKPTGRY
jgi:hypothetical protein